MRRETTASDGALTRGNNGQVWEYMDYTTEKAQPAGELAMIGKHGRTDAASSWQDEKITGQRLLLMLDQQAYRCALTGVELNPQTAAVDHIVAVSEGGQHVMSNVQIVHKAINQMKGTLPQEEFIAWCCRVAHRH